MGYFELLLIGISVAIDCFAVSLCISSAECQKPGHFINVPLHFGLFQAGMLVIGSVAGTMFEQLIKNLDHWVAFILLSAVGIKMIYESTHLKKKCHPVNTYGDILALSLATSIDALIVGVTLSVMDNNILFSAAVVGGITFALSIAGFIIGKKIQDLNTGYASILGGFVLIGIGIKTLITHML